MTTTAHTAGPSSARPRPTAGAVFYDTDLQMPLYGNGTLWTNALGAAATSPAQILNINGLGTGVGGWWNEGIGFRGSDPEGFHHRDIGPNTLKTYSRNPYFLPNATGDGVQFTVYCDGATTSNKTRYPRSELRELKADGSLASWDGGSGTHTMKGRTKVLYQAPKKPEVVVAQIHGKTGDSLELRSEGTSWRLAVDNDQEKVHLKSGVALGTEVSWEITMDHGTLLVTIDGQLTYHKKPGFKGKGQYFKVGCYAQSNETVDSANELFKVEHRGLVVTHA
jgi:hypothetical protein